MVGSRFGAALVPDLQICVCVALLTDKTDDPRQRGMRREREGGWDWGRDEEEEMCRNGVGDGGHGRAGKMSFLELIGRGGGEGVSRAMCDFLTFAWCFCQIELGRVDGGVSTRVDGSQ